MNRDISVSPRSPQTQRTRQIFAACAATLTLTVLSGCGSGGSNGNPAPTPTPSPTATPVTTPGAGNAASQTATTSAETSLNSLIAGNVTPSTSAVASVRSQFASAYTLDKSNAQAAFGLGITDIAAYATQVITDVTAATKSRHLSRAQSTAMSSISQVAEQALAWNTKSLTSSTTVAVAKSVTTLPLTLSRAGIPINSQEYDYLESDLTNLRNAIANDLALISEGANYPGLAFPVNGIYGAGLTTTIDQGDALAIEAAIYVTHAALSMVQSYNLDYGTFDYTQPLATAFPTATEGTILKPDAYLPPAPFGTLNTNGKALFAGAKNDLNTAAALILAAIPIVEKRTTFTHLIPSSTLTAADYQEAGGYASEFQAALSNAVTFDGSTINLNAWFTNPPASLRALEPTWHVHLYIDGNNSKVFGFSTAATDFPDPSFGGLIPNTSGTIAGHAIGVVPRSGYQDIVVGQAYYSYFPQDAIISLAGGGAADYDNGGLYDAAFGSTK